MVDLSSEEKEFWWHWTLASATGWALLLAVTVGGAWLGFGTGNAATTASGTGLEDLAVIGVVIVFFGGGAVIGLMQWWVLRHRINGAGRWILVSTAGWLVGFSTLSRLAGPLVTSIRNVTGLVGNPSAIVGIILFVALFWAAFGAVSSSIQWLVMQRWVNQSAGRWIVANIIGGLLAGAAGAITGMAVAGILGGAGLEAVAEAIAGSIRGSAEMDPIGGIGAIATAGVAGGALGGAASGAVTGRVLVRFIRHLRPKARLQP